MPSSKNWTAIYKERQRRLVCRDCNEPVVMVHYWWKGKTIYVKQTVQCPRHWGKRKEPFNLSGIPT